MSGTRSASDVAAGRMGDMLLQGFKMLDSSCPHCGTVLMQSRSGENICVSCTGSGDDTVQAMNQKNIESSQKIGTSGMETEDNAVSSANSSIDSIIDDIIHSMQASSSQLRSPMNLDGKKRVLEFIKLCTDCIKDLKQIQK